MNGIYLLLGSNLGNRLSNLKSATGLLSKGGSKTLNESSVYETEPWGKSDQEWFLNVVLQIETTLDPHQLLGRCLDVEKQMGRIRDDKWGERLIDIDILYFNDISMKAGDLILPHPSIEERRFTLIPLCELIPEELHPVLKQSQLELLSKCEDELDYRITEFQL